MEAQLSINERAARLFIVFLLDDPPASGKGGGFVVALEGDTAPKSKAPAFKNRRLGHPNS
jgi:hypothetical protein